MRSLGLESTLHVEISQMLPKVPPATAAQLHRCLLQESGEGSSTDVWFHAKNPFQGVVPTKECLFNEMPWVMLLIYSVFFQITGKSHSHRHFI